jgi:hypothetical protein
MRAGREQRTGELGNGEGASLSRGSRWAIQCRFAELVDFHKPRGFYDRGLLLPVREALGAIAIDIDAGELLTVVVVHGHLPVLMLSATILLYPADLFCRLFPHDLQSLESLRLSQI